LVNVVIVMVAGIGHGQWLISFTIGRNALDV
jgi:hypothetical protein